jgi:Astacin (Peptidase family M12A)
MKKIAVGLFLMLYSQYLFAQPGNWPPQGRWVGTYGNNEKNNPYYYSFDFLPGGKLHIINQNDKILGTGTYSLKEDTVKIVYKYANDVFQYACDGLLNKLTNTLNGSWQRLEDAGTANRYKEQGRWVMQQKKDTLFVTAVKLDSLRRKQLNTIKNIFTSDTGRAQTLQPGSMKGFCYDPLYATAPLPPQNRPAITRWNINSDGSINSTGVVQQPLAAITDKMWAPGAIITFGFMPRKKGSLFQQSRVKLYCKIWERVANIQFQFVEDIRQAQIKVGFDTTGGNWSWLGRDILSNPLSLQTMNFENLTDNSEEEQIKGLVLHEFGHSLGFIHEHQSPASGILDWNYANVYAYFGKPPISWSRAETDQQVIAKYNRSHTNFTTYDPSSIMHYRIPAALTYSGVDARLNNRLSRMDSQYAKQVYPFPPSPVNATGILRTGDDCDEIDFKIEYDVVDTGTVEFILQASPKITWWKAVDIPLNEISYRRLEIQNGSTNNAIINTYMLYNSKSLVFNKAKLLGVHTRLNYGWPVLPALKGGCRVTLTWRKDACL